MKNTKKVDAQYEQRDMIWDKDNNTVQLDASRSEFIPAYLKYLLKAYDIPEDATVIFLRDKEGTDGSKGT